MLRALSASIALLGLGVVLSSVAGASAPLGPTTTGGTNPWVDLSGSVYPYGTANLLTVPPDRLFVMTRFCVGNGPAGNGGTSFVQVRNGTQVMFANAAYCSGTLYMSQGLGALKFPPGSTVNLYYNAPGSGFAQVGYYIEGYYARP